MSQELTRSTKASVVTQFVQLANLEEAIKLDTVNAFLNTPPRADWLKPRPPGKGKGKYLPISRIEQLLTAICQKWYVEIKSTTVLGNSICSVVTLHYFLPQLNEWRKMDGCGAAPLQVDAGADATDTSALKSAAVQMAAPMSVSYAVKDAAQRIGAIFGRDINNKDAEKFAGIYSSAVNLADNVEEEAEEEEKKEDTEIDTAL
jgi:hypothetical protein